MENLVISDEAYEEFMGFLKSTNFTNKNLRIKYLGRRCSGPIFNIDIGKPVATDAIEEVKELKFIINKDLINEYGGFMILSNNENNGDGLILKPVIEPENNCSICPGC